MAKGVHKSAENREDRLLSQLKSKQALLDEYKQLAKTTADAYVELLAKSTKFQEALFRIQEETKYGGHPMVEWCNLVAEHALKQS